jgi:Endomembrane protein 70
MDIYLNMDQEVPYRIHWMGIGSGLVIVTLLSAMIIAILVRNLQWNINRYNKLATDESSRT